MFNCLNYNLQQLVPEIIMVLRSLGALSHMAPIDYDEAFVDECCPTPSYSCGSVDFCPGWGVGGGRVAGEENQISLRHCIKKN